MPIVLMILGFIWWWPLGLLFLGFLIARGRFGFWRHSDLRRGRTDGRLAAAAAERWERKMARMQEKMERVRARMDRITSRGGWSVRRRAATAPSTTIARRR